MATMTIERRIEFLKTANRELAQVHEAAGALAGPGFDTVNQARENIEHLWTLINRANTLLETIQQAEREVL